MKCKACGKNTSAHYEMCPKCYFAARRAEGGLLNDVTLGSVQHHVTSGHPSLERRGLILAYGCYRKYTPGDSDE